MKYSFLVLVVACGSSEPETREPRIESAVQKTLVEESPVYCIRITEELKAEQSSRTALPQGYAEQATKKRCYGHFDSAQSAENAASAFFYKKPGDARVRDAVEQVDGATVAPHLMTDAPMLISLGYLWGVDVRSSESEDALVVASYRTLEGVKVVGEMVALSGQSKRVAHAEVWDFTFMPDGKKLVFGKVFSWNETEGEKPASWLSTQLGRKERGRRSFGYDGMSGRVAVALVHLFDFKTGEVENLQAFGGTEFFSVREKLYTTSQPMLAEFCDDVSDGAKFSPKNYPYCDKTVWEVDEKSGETKEVKMTRELCEAACDPARHKAAQSVGAALQTSDGKSTWPKDWPKPRIGEVLFKTPSGGMGLVLAGRRFETYDNQKRVGDIYLQPAILR